MGLLQSLKQLVSSDSELVHRELARQSSQSGCAQVGTCQVRDRVTVQGLLATLTVQPRGERRWLEADLFDGTGQVTLVWMGRHSIPGIEAGRTLRVSGRLANDRGRKVIFNPEYEIVA